MPSTSTSTSTTPHRPHHTPPHTPDEEQPGMLPVEPDQGLVPPAIPDDPEHDRAGDPEF